VVADKDFKEGPRTTTTTKTTTTTVSGDDDGSELTSDEHDGGSLHLVKRLRRFSCILESLSASELDAPPTAITTTATTNSSAGLVLSPKRLGKVAKGSGCSEGEVLALLEGYIGLLAATVPLQ
jgi:hypothetical protein